MKNTAKQLTKKIIPNVILKNIRGCKDAFGSYYPQYIFGKGKISRLKYVSIEVTFGCNCRCLMCPLYGIQTNGGLELLKSKKENTEMTTKEFEILFKDLKGLNVKSIHFTGGEPFLRKDILNLVKLAKGHNFEVSFTTNGGLITEKISQKIVELEVDNITISLDGPKEIHEYIRKAKVFDRIMNAVEYINNEKAKRGKSRPNIGFLCTVSALNQNYLLDLVSVCKSKKIPLTIDPIIFTNEEALNETNANFNNKLFKEESFIMPEEITGIDIDALQNDLAKASKLAKRVGQPLYISISGKRSLKRFLTEQDYSIVNKCFAPWFECRIDPYGNVYPCSVSIVMGNLRKNSIKEIINNKKYVNYRNILKEKKLLPFCNKCCLLYSHNIFWNYLPRI